MAVLDVEDLHVRIATRHGPLHAVRGVSFSIEQGETFALVGESGCGKSMTALATMGLLPERFAVTGGEILFNGEDLTRLAAPRLRQLRGNAISMIFQEPMTSLNPVITVGRQIAESVQVHQAVGRREAMERAVEMLRLVQIPEPERRAGEYPHQLSGGMRQRVMIGLALACRPELLIADEPTTALDVTIQAQILALVRQLQQELGMGMIMITHDLGVVAESCDRVLVMYAGRKVEEADVNDLFDRPLHPYTRALMASMPSMNTHATRLAEIPGLVPAPHELGRGCPFAPRCSQAGERCRRDTPQLVDQGHGHQVACFAVDAGGVA